MCADLQPLRSTRRNSVETEIISSITHAHSHCRPICWGSVWKRRCAHSLARWDVATPAPNWSLSPLSRLQSLICICHICRKERHRSESTMSQKNRPVTWTYFPAVSAWPWSFACLCRLLTCEDAWHEYSYGCMILSPRTGSFLACGYHNTPDRWLCLHACTGVYFGKCAVL